MYLIKITKNKEIKIKTNPIKLKNLILLKDNHKGIFNFLIFKMFPKFFTKLISYEINQFLFQVLLIKLPFNKKKNFVHGDKF